MVEYTWDVLVQLEVVVDRENRRLRAERIAERLVAAVAADGAFAADAVVEAVVAYAESELGSYRSPDLALERVLVVGES